MQGDATDEREPVTSLCVPPIHLDVNAQVALRRRDGPPPRHGPTPELERGTSHENVRAPNGVRPVNDRRLPELREQDSRHPARARFHRATTRAGPQLLNVVRGRAGHGLGRRNRGRRKARDAAQRRSRDVLAPDPSMAWQQAQLPDGSVQWVRPTNSGTRQPLGPPILMFSTRPTRRRATASAVGRRVWPGSPCDGTPNSFVDLIMSRARVRPHGLAVAILTTSMAGMAGMAGGCVNVRLERLVRGGRIPWRATRHRAEHRAVRRAGRRTDAIGRRHLARGGGAVGGGRGAVLGTARRGLSPGAAGRDCTTCSLTSACTGRAVLRDGRVHARGAARIAAAHARVAARDRVERRFVERAQLRRRHRGRRPVRERHRPRRVAKRGSTPVGAGSDGPLPLAAETRPPGERLEQIGRSRKTGRRRSAYGPAHSGCSMKA